MNPIRFFEEQVEIWNETKKCGFCWQFSAPLKESAMNIQQIREDKKCCVQVMLINLVESGTNGYNTSGLVNDKTCNYSFNLFVLVPSRIDINNYNEIDGHPVEESKYKTIIEPLLECFGCDAILDFCEIWNYPIQVPSWRDEIVLNYQDANYDGLKFTYNFRIRK